MYVFYRYFIAGIHTFDIVKFLLGFDAIFLPKSHFSFGSVVFNENEKVFSAIVMQVSIQNYIINVLVKSEFLRYRLHCSLALGDFKVPLAKVYHNGPTEITSPHSWHSCYKKMLSHRASQSRTDFFHI